jgi:hypothetical protein
VLDRRLRDDARAVVADLELAWSRVVDSGAWVAGASAAWCAAHPLERRVHALDAERRALTGQSLWSDALWARRRAAYERQQRARAGLEVVFVPPAEGPPDAARELAERIRVRGWRAAVGAEPHCGTGEPALVVATEVDAECLHSRVGIEVCRASLAVRGRACGADRALFELSSRREEGTDSRDADRARQRAVKKIDSKALVDEAQQRILSVVGEACS